LLSQVDSLASQFFSGDVPDAFAAAANLSVDPTEIAGMNMSLMYTSNTYQAAATSTGSPVAAVGGIPSAASSAGTSGNPVAANPAPSGSDSTSGTSTSTSTTTANGTGSNASPQQTIMTFLREVMATLGRNTSAGEIQLSSRSKLQLLALAIPAYGQQTQGTQLAAATLNQMAA
jgi:hypothetical protein